MKKIIIYETTQEEMLLKFDELLTARFSELTKSLQQKAQAEIIYTRQDAAKRLGFSLPTFDRYVKDGLINGYKIGSRTRYKESDVLHALHNIKKYGRVSNEK